MFKKMMPNFDSMPKRVLSNLLAENIRPLLVSVTSLLTFLPPSKVGVTAQKAVLLVKSVTK
jgi:hypothetical protein